MLDEEMSAIFLLSFMTLVLVIIVYVRVMGPQEPCPKASDESLKAKLNSLLTKATSKKTTPRYSPVKTSGKYKGPWNADICRQAFEDFAGGDMEKFKSCQVNPDSDMQGCADYPVHYCSDGNGCGFFTQTGSPNSCPAGFGVVYLPEQCEMPELSTGQELCGKAWDGGVPSDCSPARDRNGKPLTDNAGNALYNCACTPVLDGNGNPVLDSNGKAVKNCKQMHLQQACPPPPGNCSRAYSNGAPVFDSNGNALYNCDCVTTTDSTGKEVKNCRQVVAPCISAMANKKCATCEKVVEVDPASNIWGYSLACANKNTSTQNIQKCPAGPTSGGQEDEPASDINLAGDTSTWGPTEYLIWGVISIVVVLGIGGISMHFYKKYKSGASYDKSADG